MLSFIFLGFLVGFLVGLTGIGGGALMTPSLIFLGVEPLTAVGTDLLYATVTRIFGVFFHHKKGSIRFDLSLRLFAGSLPAILLGSVLLRVIDKSTLNNYLTLLLGAILVLSSFLSLIKGEIHVPIRPRREYLYLLGFIVGLTVQFTSVGAGVIVSFALMNLAKLSPREVVGVTIFYGLGLSAFSALNYAFLGSIDYRLALVLIAGTLPGVYLGTHVNTKADRDRLKRVINVIILVIGLLILIQRVA
ncbi:sulfite exporter TauE/SafE family protein [Thermococcus sp. M39]|uniref:sulfite exporter TauE/SafE family protein n=1 Tax=unclassified Thermococcus TaxID=2627626 RepID=UPI00143B39FF|nr:MULTISPECIES: sulfite exporter TauE/SafE family protein [unclassified Thermococcus]NJE08904.1 sulfite exporter TauE/SafE family protein [Thermococcus sp. M39]NJE12822.1 sulfite exporter TauE/SafE family protein [Thermococcus sp. LS2]